MTKNKKIVSKTICILLIFLSCSSFYLSVFAENNDTNEQTNTVKPLTLQEQKNQVAEEMAKANDQLTYVESELSDDALQIQKLEDKIAEYQAQLDDVNGKYEQVQTEVNDAEANLTKIQNEYKDKDELLKNRLVALYKSGYTDNYLSVVLGAEDPLDFISKYYWVQRIAEYDSQQIDEVEKKKQEATKLAADLNEKKASMKIIKNQAESGQIVLENTKTILESHRQSLDESQKQIVSSIDSYKRQQQELENMIRNSISSINYELKYSGGQMIWPTVENSYITSPYGTRLHPITGIYKNHTGIDISGNDIYGKSVYAAKDRNCYLF